MRKTWRWILGLGITAFVIAGLIPPVGTSTPAHRAIALKEALQVALALRLYAEDHEGRLPATLQELYPDYLVEEPPRMIRNMTLTMPRASLKDLPADYIIAWKLIPEDGDRIVAVHPDAAVEIIRGDPTPAAKK